MILSCLCTNCHGEKNSCTRFGAVKNVQFHDEIAHYSPLQIVLIIVYSPCQFEAECNSDYRISLCSLFCSFFFSKCRYFVLIPIMIIIHYYLLYNYSVLTGQKYNSNEESHTFNIGGSRSLFLGPASIFPFYIPIAFYLLVNRTSHVTVLN